MASLDKTVSEGSLISVLAAYFLKDLHSLFGRKKY